MLVMHMQEFDKWIEGKLAFFIFFSAAKSQFIKLDVVL